MPSKKNRTPIEADKYYHIYNRGNNYEVTFKTENDYFVFLWLIKKYINPIANIYAYALLPNHYHLLLKTKYDLTHLEFGREFSQLIAYYTYLFNKRENRSGNLFLKPFKRILIESDEYLKRLVFYIHFNPQKHKAVNRYQKYKFSSFKAYQYDSNTSLNTQDILEIFGSRGNFYEYHEYFEELDNLNEYSLED